MQHAKENLSPTLRLLMAFGLSHGQAMSVVAAAVTKAIIAKAKDGIRVDGVAPSRAAGSAGDRDSRKSN